MSGNGPEIERSWLLKHPHHLKSQSIYHEIGYLFTDGGELRLVDKRDLPVSTYWITIKSDGNLIRDEWEHMIPKWAFDQLWPKTEGVRVHKTRHYIIHGAHCLEIDEYKAPHEGLIRMECEFSSKEEASKFKLPWWAQDAKEVTNDSRFKNKNLALNGLPEDWNSFMKEEIIL